MKPLFDKLGFVLNMNIAIQAINSATYREMCIALNSFDLIKKIPTNVSVKINSNNEIIISVIN